MVKKILFDTGYSDAFIKNANILGENLLDLDYIIFSHGHIDHTWGMSSYLKHYYNYFAQGNIIKIPIFLTPPLSFNSKKYEHLGEIGSFLSEKKISRFFDIKKSEKPVWITYKLVWLGNIPRVDDFENLDPLGKVDSNLEEEIDDYLVEDTAMVYFSDKGLVVISACSYPGICNIIEYAKKVTKIDKVYDVI